ncbi:MAG: hypothetical protein A4E65_02398 [Syntrophorhabdus sp. PtaU1.Bin153]|nr:MAG: hypothetical protein A4E65_02398 [Syntrophorhabdus sp. PtaU1.Bin153]
MNKKANRRAFFICLLVGIMYLSVATGLPGKMTLARVSEERQAAPTSMGVAMTRVDPEASSPPEVSASAAGDQRAVAEWPKAPLPASGSQTARDDTGMIRQDDKSLEPGLFMSVPIVCYAIRKGLIERDGLIFVQKEGYNKGGCKKPIDILRDRDEQGLKALARIVDRKQSLDFLKKEGIVLKQDIDNENIILGVGYTVEKDMLVALYNKYVPEEYGTLFPFAARGMTMVKTGKGFGLTHTRGSRTPSHAAEEKEWMMPNLLNLPMRVAIEKLTVHTSRIKVRGSGTVVEQYPRPFERTRGETECIVYGRSAK